MSKYKIQDRLECGRFRYQLRRFEKQLLKTGSVPAEFTERFIGLKRSMLIMLDEMEDDDATSKS